MKREIRIYGRVQGVGFRYFAGKEARTLNIVAFPRNESDGSVYIEAEGDEASLEKFIEWCRKGPKEARVENVEVI